MRKSVFLALLIFIYYIAGMYENPALMVLFLTQLFLIPVMFILSRYLKKHLSVSVEEKTVFAEKDRPFTWTLKAENRGRLPVTRFALRFQIFRNGKAVKKRKVYGNTDCGEHFISVQDRQEHCGIISYRSEELRVFDYLSLFSGKRRVEEKTDVFVFPPRYEMQIRKESDSDGLEDQYPQVSFLPGNNYEEVRQIREYRDGDSVRHIHWNQTARRDSLWVKEYEEETKGRAVLFLDLKDGKDKTESALDAFYTLAQALIQGLMRNVSSVQVYWNCGTDRTENSGKQKPEETEAAGKDRQEIYGMEIREEDQCRELLCVLYRALETDGGKESVYAAEPPDLQGAMRLTLDLVWFKGEDLIFRFSEENLGQELSRQNFEL